MSKKKSTRQDSEAELRVSGAISLNGMKWVEVRQDKSKAWFPLRELMTNPQGVKARLAEGGIIIFGSGYSRFLQEVQELRDFPAKNLLEEPGWTKSCFAMQNGKVFAPPKQRAVAVFDADHGKCARSGTLNEWLCNVAELLAGQTIAMFMLMAMFVAPILKLTHRSGNIGFELVGPPGTGKSTLLHLMATIIGGGAEGSGSRYWKTCNTTVNALERKAESHSDLPLLLDDATIFAAEDSGLKRGNSFKSFIFNLAQGETKDRLNGGKQRAFRTVYFLTSNLPLSDVIADVAEREAGATADRLLTLDVGLREYGIFDYIPAEYSDATAYARALVDSMAAYHGTAMPHFLQRLVNHRARDESGLRAGIRRRADAFIERANVDRSDGSAVRVAEVFGLVMAAGQLAQKYGALPASYDCEEAAVGAYRLFQASTERDSYEDRLLAYASDPAVLDMDALDLKYVSDEQFAEAPGFMRSHRDGHREFIVNPDTFRRAFPDWQSLLRDPKVAFYLQTEGRDGQRKRVKRELRKGHPNDRLYCFQLPITPDGSEG